MAITQTGGTPESIRAAVALALSPERRRLVVTAAAREAQARAEAAYRQEFGRLPSTEIVVDGRAGAFLDGLDPDQGEVAFRFSRAAEALTWIYDQIVQHSPVLSGEYRGAHVLLADDQKVDPANPPPAQRYVFMNLTAYARKIEEGESSQAPGGVYQAVAVMADRRFGNSVHVGFGYESPLLDYVAGEAGRGARARLRQQPTRAWPG
ncbi:hypothetical protein R1A27_20180 [Methylobacterium sp. NMS12]|uniref:hypothetical protein n=1 Tax=Methylobacterium sp. NMS12 TaxID=3079766 RepID=UPI003F880A35